MYSVTKVFKCDIAERNWAKGEANTYIRGRHLYDFSVMNPEFQIHGHTLYIEVSLQGEDLDDTGFILDTDVLKELLKDKLNSLDHTYLIHKKDPIFPEISKLAKNHKIKIYATDYVISYEHIAKDIYDHCMQKLQEHGFDKFAQVKSVSVHSKTIGGGYTPS